MSAPRIVVQIVVAGAKIFGKAFYAAGRQAVQNAKYRPPALSGDAAGVGHATTGSLTDRLTREHRMTADEARLILNIKKGDTLEQITKHYEHLFKANSPPPPPPKPAAGASKRQPPPLAHSHYLQSKVVRARERLDAELKAPAEEAAVADAANASSPPPPPPPSSAPPPS